jgi:hypothetical protein
MPAKAASGGIGVSGEEESVMIGNLIKIGEPIYQVSF